MRKEKLVTWEKELALINTVADKLLAIGLNASNSTIITVSTDYSSIVGQILRHKLSHNEEIASGFGIDVPYPDERWDDTYIKELSETLKLHADSYKNKNVILVEAAVIRGGNYTYITEWIQKHLGTYRTYVTTVTLFENIGSKFKSNIVGEYYDDNTDDVTFWWETKNKHWKN
jgi:hypothetical protein